MNEEELSQQVEHFLQFRETKDIPSQFYSAYEEGPFNKCLDCGKSLLEPSQLYEIQKVVKVKEVIFEYALCVKCGESLSKEYSKESLASIQNFFLENYTPLLEKRENCHFCEKETSLERSLVALCKGDQLIWNFTICQQCMEGLEKLISKETRKTMDDFIEKKFPGIPAEFSPFSLIGSP